MHNDKRCRTHSIRFRFLAGIFFYILILTGLRWPRTVQMFCLIFNQRQSYKQMTKMVICVITSLSVKKLFSFFYTVLNVDGITTWMGELGTDFTVVSTGPESFLLEGTGSEKLSSLFQHLCLVGPLAISLVNNNNKKVFSFSPFRVYTQTMF